MGKLLHSRIRKVEKLPPCIKEASLVKINTTINIERWGEDIVEQACRLALASDPSTPLPGDQLFRYTNTILDGMVARYMDVGMPLAKDLSNLTSIADLAFWKLDESGTEVKFALNNSSVELPGSVEMMGWTLVDPLSLRCVAIATKFKGCSVVLLDNLSVVDALVRTVGVAWGVAASAVQSKIASFQPFVSAGSSETGVLE